MILQFWLTSILLVIIASALLTIPFIRSYKNRQQGERRNQLNRALYDIRLTELENDEAQDLIVDKETFRTELQHNLLDDVIDKETPDNYKNSKMLWLPAVLILVFGSYGLYSSVGAYQEVEQWQSVMERYPDLQNKLFNDQDSSPSEQELRDLMLGLRTQLSQNSNNADGWLLYSRLAMVFKETEVALDAIKKALLLDPKSLNIRLVDIQLKMQTGDAGIQNQAESLLTELLREYPNELQAWSMYAFIALEKKDYALAIQRWEKMQTLVENDSPQAETLRDSIGYAKQQMSKDAGSVIDNATPNLNNSIDNLPAAIGVTYRVEISVDDNVVVPKDGFLFVYAQAVGGPPMPIAALKIKLPTFPATIELSDANSMVKGVKLSDYPNFIIKARISVDGNASNSAGQWQGESPAIAAGEKQNVKVLVSQLLE
ncbi:cytochrome c-type biogenesis protein CcmI [Psychromonas ingrahamii 37]|uniref:Cytochrome c-type biogenesis protein CcmI n=1 Tax=Psychromonas ingrahamii (strain DSM 17664 / CCUG 51855 / 37) TaxID=357804 RepID=A1SZ03_PSYIN|nr:c-type cytochrome biogenesis protein CcmI [Psychromonas ingrahamii]ABM04718.1 cytochrome c-type biogenesis protein CcmI [Psychromonas ingrahamii 37]